MGEKNDEDNSFKDGSDALLLIRSLEGVGGKVSIDVEALIPRKL